MIASTTPMAAPNDRVLGVAATSVISSDAPDELRTTS